MTPVRNRGGRPRGLTVATTASGLHDLGVLDLAEAAAEHQAAMRALAHAFRRCNDTGAHLSRAYARITTAWAREHGDEQDPAPLAEVVPLPVRRRPQPPTSPQAVAA